MPRRTNNFTTRHGWGDDTPDPMRVLARYLCARSIIPVAVSRRVHRIVRYNIYIQSRHVTVCAHNNVIRCACTNKPTPECVTVFRNTLSRNRRARSRERDRKRRVLAWFSHAPDSSDGASSAGIDAIIAPIRLRRAYAPTSSSAGDGWTCLYAANGRTLFFFPFF